MLCPKTKYSYKISAQCVVCKIYLLDNLGISTSSMEISMLLVYVIKALYCLYWVFHYGGKQIKKVSLSTYRYDTLCNVLVTNCKTVYDKNKHEINSRLTQLLESINLSENYASLELLTLVGVSVSVT